MTPQKQQIAIGEMCPDTLVEWHDGKPYWKGEYHSSGMPWDIRAAEFDPLSDLNAIQAAIKAQTEEVQRKVAYHIIKLLSEARWLPCQIVLHSINLEPAQLCKALLLALGKWEEGT